MTSLLDVLDLASCFLEDKSPVACAASGARCSCHFSSYLVAGEAWIKVACYKCPKIFQTKVSRHGHPRRGLIVYFGAPHSYAWDTESDTLLCEDCYSLSLPGLQVQSLSESSEKAVKLKDAEDTKRAT